MLQPSLCADRPFSRVDASLALAGERSAKRSVSALSLLVAFGRGLLRPTETAPLNDRLLRDIGVSRADLDALSL